MSATVRLPPAAMDVDDTHAWPCDNTDPPPSLCHSLAHRELVGNKAPKLRATRAQVHMALPSTLREAELGCVYDLGVDKVFSLVWLDHQSLLLGTKCNQLYRVSLGRSDSVRRALRIPLPELHTPADSASSPARRGISPGLAANHNGPHIAKVFKWRVRMLRLLGEQMSGMHSMAMSPSGSKVAVGAAQPWDVAILDAHTLSGQALCTGHHDCVFAVEWLTDDILVSGSRDRLLKVWDTRSAGSHGGAALPVLSPVGTCTGHARRLRALSHMTGPQLLASLSVDGVVRLWDASGGLMPVGTGITLPGIVSEDTCCLASAGPTPNGHVASHPHVLVAGGLELYVLDVRCRGTERTVLTMPAHDRRLGVRSLSMLDHLLTVGAADGSLSFLDMRAGRYMPVRAALPGGMQTDQDLETLRVGPGRRRDGGMPQGHNDMTVLSQAVFCHAWDPTHRRLATAGGPILAGTAGCYAAVWS